MLSLAVSEEDDSLKKTMDCLDYLAHHKVDVGLTSSASGRSLFLMAIHERGSPIMHIPPRPIVRPALQKEAANEAMTACCLEACEAAFDGDLPATVAALEATGQAGVDAIHAYMDAGVPPPNSPITLSGGWIYNRVAHKGVYVEGKSGDKPMIDTGALYNDFDYEVNEL